MHLAIDGMFVADIFGFILALPMALFLAFWLSAVRKRSAVVFGALIAEIIGFFIIWVVAENMPNANGAAVFFGALLFNSTMGLIGGMITDLLVGRILNKDYRRTVAHS
jgi:hypothetical protein